MSTIRINYLVALLVFPILLSATSAKAEVIRVDFEAEVTTTWLLPIFGISPVVGDRVLGYFIYQGQVFDF